MKFYASASFRTEDEEGVAKINDRYVLFFGRALLTCHNKSDNTVMVRDDYTLKQMHFGNTVMKCGRIFDSSFQVR